MGNGILFKSKVALVTGGSSGIGRATALAFAKEGAKVVLAARTAADGEKTVSLIRNLGGEAVFLRTDVSLATDVQTMVAKSVEAFGRIDCAFNNAGISGTPFVPTADYDIDTWDEVVAVNLRGIFLCVKYELQHMLPRGGGAIVNNSSTSGLRNAAAMGVAYGASKHGIIGLTKTAAVENASKGVRINAICPGFIETRLSSDVLSHDPAAKAKVSASIPIGRAANPEEVAAGVLWLCSEAASYVTGHSLVIDGGLMA